MIENAGPVIFSNDDYATVSRRIVSFLIDLVALWLTVGIVVTAISTTITPPSALKGLDKVQRQHESNRRIAPYRIQLNIAICAAVLFYHVLLRTTRGGTVGYRLTGIRLVNEFGNPIDLRTAGRRFLLAVPGCLGLGLTYLKCVSDPLRQASHDRYAGTWLVRKNASPAGPAVAEYQQKAFGPYPIQFPVLTPKLPENQAQAASPDQSPDKSA